MSPQQKHAVIVMIESIEHQLAAVKTLLVSQSAEGEGATAPHRTHKPARDDGYLSEAEEAELDKIMEPDPQFLTSFLQSALADQPQTPQEG